jgi:uncharacterized protein YndB with AHSA1/START domain
MTDHASHITTVQRAVTARTVDGAPAKAVLLSRTYDTPIDDVWDACTTAERISRWLMPVIGDLRLGGRYQLEGNAAGQVLECEPPRRLAVTWEYAEQVSWVRVSLEPTEQAGTVVQVEHLAPITDHWDQFGPGAVGIGWDMMLLGLSLHLQGGSLGSPEEAGAWTASEDGREFMHRSGEAWHAADVDGGENPAQARAAADRTIAAYTGAPEATPGD